MYWEKTRTEKHLIIRMYNSPELKPQKRFYDRQSVRLSVNFLQYFFLNKTMNEFQLITISVKNFLFASVV